MGSYKWIISPLIWVITTVTLLITLLITTHEPPSKGRSDLRVKGETGSPSWDVSLGFRV